MIKFVTGLPGAGKSLYSVIQLIEELRRTSRRIVTNLALRLHPWVDGRGKARKGLLRVLLDTYGETFDAENRIIQLDVESTGDFFLRGRSQVPAAYQNASGKFVCMPEMGVAYFIDELHEFFPSNSWEKQSGLTQSWATQHRRAGDDAWVISQHPMLVANQFRRLCQECISMQNRKFRRLMLWRQPDLLSFSVYQSTPPKDTEPAMYSGLLRGGRERIYECYDTAAGVGVSGSVADVDTKPTGLPFWTSAVAVGLVLVLVGMVWLGCTKIISRALRFKSNVVSASLPTNLVHQASRVGGFTTGFMERLPFIPPPRFTNEVAFVQSGTAGWVVLWGDGTMTLTPIPPYKVGRDWVIEGVVYPSCLPPRGQFSRKQ